MGDLILFRAGGRDFTREHVIAVADWRGDLQPLRALIRAGLICQQYAQDERFELADSELQSASDAFRADRDLTAAEDTERWLALRGLTFDDLVAWLERRAWADRFGDRLETLAADYPCAAEDVEDAVWPEVVFGGQLASLARALAERVAARVEAGPVEGRWAHDFDALEQAYADRRSAVTAGIDMRRELTADVSSLTRCEVEFAAFPSAEMAREAWLCVTSDGQPLADVAEESGVEAQRLSAFVPELPDSVRARVLAAAPNDVVAPFADGEAFLVLRVGAKLPPGEADADVRARVERVALTRALDELVQRHVRWADIMRDSV